MSVPDKPPESTPPSPEVLAQLQPAAQALAQLMVQVGPARDPVLEKVTTEILSQAITAQSEKDQRSHELGMRKALLDPLFSIGGAVVILLVVLLFVVVLLYWGKADKIDLILGVLLGFAAGAFGGYGYAKKSEADKKE